MSVIKPILKKIYNRLPVFVQGLIFIIYANLYRLTGRKGNDSCKNHSASDIEEKIQRELIGASKTVLAICHEFSMTGAPIVLLHLADVLKAQGYKIVIISPKDGKLFRDEAEKRGIITIYCPDLFETDLVLKLSGLFDKIIVQTLICYPVINMLKETGKDVMWWIHEGPEIYYGFIARALPRRLPDNIHVYCVGGYARRALKCRYPRYRIHNLLYYSPDLKAAKSQESDIYKLINTDKKVFMLVGYYCRRKGQDILARAIDMLPEDVRKGSLFVFVGKFAKEEKEKKSGEYVVKISHKYPDSVIYSGELSIEQVYRLYSKIDFLICSSREDPMPVVITEAMSLGKPSICSENTGSAAIIKRHKAGMTYGFNSPLMLKKRIDEAYHMPLDDYNKMSKRARRCYKHYFSREIFEKNVRKIFE